ncbi:TetR/AcrR family transcriptional regulator [Streptococcus sp. X16XC17]|uniref:TetR/AcrR family transcriptional regulator n=1 Tax=Streptococcus sp. X16XC17 TaxID=2316646 RepID=UPI00103E2443|nr:TetR/AcrR family transcriptional regulator [Streptococcus sp. X16XC17]TCD46797.1 TetR/AcrR family transcriptional regulator [Streptococcus sp. X16XC17]
MKKRTISPSSLKNLIISNKESNQLTKESIETALLFLMEKKDLHQISISELVRKAGVSRNAFYRNYKSKEEILEHAYARKSQIWADKWQHLQERIQRQGLKHSLSDLLQEQKDKVGKKQTLTNISQWIKEKKK